MATDLTLAEIADLLRADEPVEDWFSVLRALSTHTTFTDGGGDRLARDSLIRVLARREELNGYSPLLDSLVVSAGLYPYANIENLSSRDALEYEAHRPGGLDEADIVFHRVQAMVYRFLANGESVILSAPTSFGKSLIIDGLLATSRITQAAIILPTLALVDETRRRLSSRFGDRYKIITHPHQEQSDSQVFVMTQERILDVEELPHLDFFAIDEFYKLDPAADADRSYLLNHAFYLLRKVSDQFYLLGPNIESIPAPLNQIARLIVTDFSTVALDTVSVDTSAGDEEALVELCSQVAGDPTIIFCRSPKQARDVANLLVERLPESVGSPASRDLSAWAGERFHPEWSFVRATARGIGLHHGRLPRSMAQLVVRQFNRGDLKFLVCTSTLIEGVNTAAKNVVIYDNKIAMKKYDYFTFNNIRGRSGRMFSHFVGCVYLFHSQPDERLRDIDVPVLTFPEGVDPALLVQLDDADLTDDARSALADEIDEQALAIADVKASAGLSPAGQTDLARRLRTIGMDRLQLLSWTGFPTGPQLRFACDLLWEDLNGKRSRSSYVRSSAQLAFRLNRLSFEGFDALLRYSIDENDDPDEAVEDVLDFCRNWAGFTFPRLVMALDRIQQAVLPDRGVGPGSYGFYASRVEALFRPRSVVALEEYGIPMQIAERLQDEVDLDGELDDVLATLRHIDLNLESLSAFERSVVVDALDVL